MGTKDPADQDQVRLLTELLALIQATRPIDYYVHRRIQENPGLNTAENSATIFASTMRALLADIAAIVAQALYVLLAKKPTVKRQQVRPFCRRQQYTIPTDTYSSNTVTAPSTSAATTEDGFNNRTSDRQANFCGRGCGQGRRQPMGLGHSTKRIHNSLQKPLLSNIGVVEIEKTAEGRIIESDDTNSEVGGTCCELKGLTASAMFTISAINITPESLQEKAETRSKQNFNRGSGISPKKKCNRRSSNKEAWLLQLPESKQICSRSELQNGNAVFNLPNDTTRGLHDVVRPQGCFSTHTGVREMQKIFTIPLEREGISIQSPPLWPVSKPIGIHQNSSSSSLIGQKTRHKNICIPGRSPDSGRIQRGVHLKHATSLFQALGTWIQYQHREIGNNAISINNAFGNGHQLTRNVTKSPIFQSQGPTQRSEQNIERRPDDIEMLSELHWEGSSNVNSSSSGTSNASTPIRVKKQLPNQIELLDIN
ncbi:hypothetical protein BB561_003726, partial [Smittium simulii]